MIFKRFSFHRKKPELCNICKHEMLKNNFYSQDKILSKSFSKGFFEYTYRWVFVFPSPWPFTWPQVLALAPAPGPGPQFVFTSPDSHLVFTGPGTKFIFTSPDPQFVFTSPGPHLVLTPNLYLSVQLNAWVCIYLPCLPNLYLLALAYNLYAHRLLSWFTHNDAE